MKPIYSLIAAALLMPFAPSAWTQGVNLADGVALRRAPAWVNSVPAGTPLLGAARSGERMIAVGARGMVLVSDDAGGTWQQAKAVPVRVTLSAVYLNADGRAWAVGQNGAIIASTDGGQTWVLQRFDAAADRPLFSVYFSDAKHGVAVGLWSLVLVTADGGTSWTEVKLPAPPDGGKADRNLFKVFADPAGALYVAAERGSVLRSTDHGATWSYLTTGYKGSLWAGAALDDGSLLVGGLRGSLYRSTNHGALWQAVKSGTQSSITDIVAAGSNVTAAGLDGLVLQSVDAGASFKATAREDRLPLTAVLLGDKGSMQLFSKQGVVKP